MKIKYSQPDIQTIIKRIDEHVLNLQPNFQRGEVWSPSKKQRLIDSILRDWYVPPIHVIELSDGNQEVLDGQQRLVSIRDFVHGNIKIDGNIEPFDSEIHQLDGLTYQELPRITLNNFNRFTITVNTITDYRAEEPGELFYRLNQPIRLSSAEERNAFFGEPRQQVKDLVALLSHNGIDSEFLGFSNSRMAYDDVLARLCYTLELGTLHEKVTSPMLASKYRSNDPFTPTTITKIYTAIKLLGNAKEYISPIEKRKFNRASLFSWLLFIISNETLSRKLSSPKLIGSYIFFFESLRAQRRMAPISDNFTFENSICPSNFVDQLMEIYIDRSTSRVTDVNSVLARDIILWTFFGFYLSKTGEIDISHSFLTVILKQINLSKSKKGDINPIIFLDRLIEEWDGIK